MFHGQRIHLYGGLSPPPRRLPATPATVISAVFTPLFKNCLCAADAGRKGAPAPHQCLRARFPWVVRMSANVRRFTTPREHGEAGRSGVRRLSQATTFHRLRRQAHEVRDA
jgi:uncharacterized protein YchJ